MGDALLPLEAAGVREVVLVGSTPHHSHHMQLKQASLGGHNPFCPRSRPSAGLCGLLYAVLLPGTYFSLPFMYQIPPYF